MSQANFVVKFDAVTRTPLLPRTAGEEYTLFDGMPNAGFTLCHNVTIAPPTVMVRVRSSPVTLRQIAADANCRLVCTVLDTEVDDETLTPAQVNAFCAWLVAQGHADNAAMAVVRAATTRREVFRRLMTNLYSRDSDEAERQGSGLLVERYSTLVFAPVNVSELYLQFAGKKKLLFTIGAYRLWQAVGEKAALIDVHNELYATAPLSTLGLVAAVQHFGDSFFGAAVKNAVNMTNPEWIARRNRIANYYTAQGYNGAPVAAATDENELATGIIIGRGYTMAQLWSAMLFI